MIAITQYPYGFHTLKKNLPCTDHTILKGTQVYIRHIENENGGMSETDENGCLTCSKRYARLFFADDMNASVKKIVMSLDESKTPELMSDTICLNDADESVSSMSDWVDKYLIPDTDKTVFYNEYRRELNRRVCLSIEKDAKIGTAIDCILLLCTVILSMGVIIAFPMKLHPLFIATLVMLLLSPVRILIAKYIKDKLFRSSLEAQEQSILRKKIAQLLFGVKSTRDCV